MKELLIKKFSIFLFFFICGSASISKENSIIVKVENEIITSYQIKNKIKTLLVLSQQEINQENINKTKNQAVLSLINTKLKKNEISKFKIKADEKSVQQQLQNISSNNLVEFKNLFKKYNLDYNLFLEEIKIEMAWQKLIYSIYNKKVRINDQEIETQISNLKLSEKNEEYRLSEIEIIASDLNDREKKIEMIKQQVKEIGFDSAAIKFSTSSSSSNKGDIGWIKKNSLSSKILDTIKDLKIGEVSKPILTGESILFLKLVDIRNKDYNDIDKVKIRDSLIAEKKNELFSLYSRSHLSKIRNNALIEYN